jgi:excisionase family DNA binding protein
MLASRNALIIRMLDTQPQAKSRARVKQLGRLTFGIDEVAAQRGVCDNTVRAEFHAGKLRGFRIGKRILISAEALRTYLAERETRSAD